MTRTSRISHETILHSFDVEPEARWWDALESNFYRRPEGFDLSLSEELMVRPTAAFDRVVRTVGSAALALTIFPFGYHSREFKRSFEDRDFYQPLAESGDPTQFFAEPPKNVPVKHSRARPLIFRPKDGTCELLTFKSPFQTVEPASPRALREAS